MATLLYIDQDEASQQLIQATLGQHYNIITVADGPTAIQYCAIMSWLRGLKLLYPKFPF